MSRKSRAKTKYVKLNKAMLDSKYASNLIAKLIKYVMKNGKFNQAKSIVYKSIDMFYDDYMKKAATEDEKNLQKTVMVKLLIERIIKMGPDAEVKSKRLGGQSYQVPVSVDADRKVTLVYRVLLKCARKRKGTSMFVNLGRELIDLCAGRGSVIKEFENLRKTVSLNAVFANIKGRSPASGS